MVKLKKVIAAPAVLFQPLSGNYLITNKLHTSYKEAKEMSVLREFICDDDLPGDYYWEFWHWPAKFENGAWVYDGIDYSHLTFGERMKLRKEEVCGEG